MNILSVKNLNVTIQRKKESPRSIIRGIDLDLPKGKIVGIVGESGSGKSMTMKSLMGILPPHAKLTYDSYVYNGKEATKKLPVSMIFQDPMTSLNPVRTIGYHLIEVRMRQGATKKTATSEALRQLELVGINEPLKRFRQYPHELSGGMRQRVMIAMALLAKPELLIADEPTTALDVTIQAQILKLIKNLQQENDLSVALVTHDFGVVAGMCDFVKVMYQGKIVEEGTVDEIFYEAKHPYTQQLLKAADLSQDELHLMEGQQEISETLFRHPLSDTHFIWLEKEESSWLNR